MSSNSVTSVLTNSTGNGFTGTANHERPRSRKTSDLKFDKMSKEGVNFVCDYLYGDSIDQAFLNQFHRIIPEHQIAEKLSWCLEHGADILAECEGKNALHLACGLETIEPISLIFRRMINAHEKKIEESPQQLPTEPERLEALEKIEKEIIQAKTKRSEATPLHMASINASPKLVSWLLNKGAAVNCEDINGCTPLHDAVSAAIEERDHPPTRAHAIEVCKLLIDAEVEINATNDQGLTALDYANDFHDQELCQLLTQHGGLTSPRKVRHRRETPPTPESPKQDEKPRGNIRRIRSRSRIRRGTNKLRTISS